MNDNHTHKLAQVDATPNDSGPDKPACEPGETPDTSEAEAQLDKPVPADKKRVGFDSDNAEKD